MEIHQSPVQIEQVCALLADIFQVPLEQITPDLMAGDIPQWDSIGHMDMMIRLEEQYGAEISTDTIANLTSVPAICEYLNTLNTRGEQP